MESKLVCKIDVETSDGRKLRGTGYPITPDRMITAAHVVTDAKRAKEGSADGDPRCITLSCGLPAQKLTTPVWLEWSGREQGVDVAVLRCELPPDLLPIHHLATQSLDKLTKWRAQGYTDFGKRRRPDHKDDYYGTLGTLAIESPTVVLNVDNGLTQAQQWRGGSGSVAFEADMPQRALAVITACQDGKKLDQLVAVPLGYLLHADGIRDGFRRAIQCETYAQRQKHYQHVIDAIASQLKTLGKALGEEGVYKIVDHLCADDTLNTQGIDRQVNEAILPGKIATCFVTHSAVIDVVRSLMALGKKLGTPPTEAVSAIIDHLLPLNYAPAIIHDLRERSTGQQLVGLIEDKVATQTLAEVIMAGYDGQPATFVVAGGEHPRLRGERALDYCDGPEEGPGVLDAEIVALRVARNMLFDLVLLKDAMQGRSPQHRGSRGETDAEQAALEGEIKAYASQLQGAVNAARYRDQRTLYCVLTAPEMHERASRRRVLDIIRAHVPCLFFVALIPQAQADNDVEFEIDDYIQGRLRHLS